MNPVLRPTVVALFWCLLPAVIWSQQPAMMRAFELERRADYAGAANAYRTILKGNPSEVSALLGLERSLLPLNRTAEMIPAVRAALAAAPTSSAAYGVALRAWAAADQPDSVRSFAERWARVAPTDESPYREWGASELGRQNRAGARAAYLEGRQRIGRPDALSAELAQLALSEGDYPVAAREWLLAVHRLPGYKVTAVSTLSQAPERVRPELLRLLTAEPDLMSRRIESELRAGWGDPLGAVRVLEGALPADRVQAIGALQGLLDQLRTLRTAEGQQAQGRVLEAISERVPPAQASRLRLDAARAYSAGGDRDAARRMLAGLADSRDTPANVSADAGNTLLSVLISDGKLDEAQKRLADLRPGMSADQYDLMRRKLVMAWIRSGELGRADSAIAPDSSVDGLAVSGQVRLYLGDIAGALARFKAAGPYAGDREEATGRTKLMALIQPIEKDTLPALGRALLQLEQGDSAEAAAGLERVATGLPIQQGGAELHLLAGRLLAASGKSTDAERLFRAAAAKAAPATASAAELALAELLISSQRTEDAVSVLEHLILTYPQSALVPQARRELDQARGAVPKT
jgi:hypothetical protein